MMKKDVFLCQDGSALFHRTQTYARALVVVVLRFLRHGEGGVDIDVGQNLFFFFRVFQPSTTASASLCATNFECGFIVTQYACCCCCCCACYCAYFGGGGGGSHMVQSQQRQLAPSKNEVVSVVIVLTWVLTWYRSHNNANLHLVVKCCVCDLQSGMQHPKGCTGCFCKNDRWLFCL